MKWNEDDEKNKLTTNIYINTHYILNENWKEKENILNFKYKIIEIHPNI